MKILKTLFALVFVLVSSQAALAVTTGELTVSSTSQIACTMDVKLCPDGVTYVGRTAPSCAFAQCPTVPVVCIDLKYDLKVGSTDSTTNGEVTKLQSFLYPQYLRVEATGRLLGLTRAASVEFQKQYGISPAFGYVGAITRAKIKELTCGGTSQTLAINSITPSYAKVGETVVLNGPGLNSGGDFILFDGYRIETDGSKALNRIGFIVPEYITNTINCITTPCPLGFSKKVVPGVYTVQVVNNLGTTNTVKLTVTDGTVVPPPNETIKISWVEPSAAKVGTSVIIYGYNLFRPETRILFDGVSISGKPVYSKQAGNFNSALEFVVPSYLSTCNGVLCSATAGRIVIPGTYELAVDNKYGRDSVKFEVLPSSVVTGKPYLSALAPTQGMVGTEVIIFGQNLNTGSESVYFGGSSVSSTLLNTDSKGMIRFKVPEYITPCGYADNTACKMLAQQVVPGKYEVVVKNAAGVSNVLIFTVTATGTTVAPKLNSLTPSYGVTGTEVVIKGEGINIGDDKIYFKGSLVPQVYSGSDVTNTLRFKVPSYITSCGIGTDGTCKIAAQSVTPGLYEVVVVNKNGTSNTLNFTVTGTVSTDLAITSFYATDYTFTNGSALSLGRKLVWTSTGARYCESSGAWSGTRTVNGEWVIGFMSQPLTYTLTCYNDKGISVSKSVTDPNPGTTQAPVISSVDPSVVNIGSVVSLTGERLNTGNAKIVFGNGYITPDATRSSDSLLVFTVPSSMPRYCSPSIEMACTDDMIPVTAGSYDLKVVNSFGTSNVKSVFVFALTSAEPSISSISPSAGGTG
ncbi:MAG: IPT/TIG domain-containing protein, partial [Minisyncoccia bacterium]